MNTTFEYRVSSGMSIVHERAASRGVSLSATAVSSSLDSDPKEIDVTCDTLDSMFLSNYECWNNDTNFLSTNNYDNPNFKAIVDMGESIVPKIFDIISKKPHPIVHALDLIYPDYMTYKGILNQVHVQ